MSLSVFIVSFCNIMAAITMMTWPLQRFIRSATWKEISHTQYSWNISPTHAYTLRVTKTEYPLLNFNNTTVTRENKMTDELSSLKRTC